MPSGITWSPIMRNAAGSRRHARWRSPPAPERPLAVAARWAGLARDTAIVGAVSLGLFLLLELGLRVFAPQSLQGTSLRGEHFSAEDSILGYRYVPGAVWRFRHPEYSVEYAINGQGFRDATAHPVPKPPGTIRVLLIG